MRDSGGLRKAETEGARLDATRHDPLRRDRLGFIPESPSRIHVTEYKIW